MGGLRKTSLGVALWNHRGEGGRWIFCCEEGPWVVTRVHVCSSRYQSVGATTPQNQTTQWFISMRPEELEQRARIKCSLSTYALAPGGDSHSKKAELFALLIAWLELVVSRISLSFAYIQPPTYPSRSSSDVTSSVKSLAS